MKKNCPIHHVLLSFLMVFTAIVVGCQECDELRNEAKDLKTDHQKCESGDTCVIVDIASIAGANNCLAPFQCPISLNEKNIATFKSDAKELAGEYEDCDACATASCVSLTNHVAFCNEETSLCDAQEQN